MPLPVRGKPRYMGLILTGLLLLALAVVAAWSSFYLSSNEADPNAAPAANAVASATDPATEALPSVADEALADGQDPDLATASAVTGAEAFAELAPTEPTPSRANPRGANPSRARDDGCRRTCARAGTGTRTGPRHQRRDRCRRGGPARQ